MLEAAHPARRHSWLSYSGPHNTAFTRQRLSRIPAARKTCNHRSLPGPPSIAAQTLSHPLRFRVAVHPLTVDQVVHRALDPDHVAAPREPGRVLPVDECLDLGSVLAV